MAARTVLLLASLCIIAHLITSKLAKIFACSAWLQTFLKIGSSGTHYAYVQSLVLKDSSASAWGALEDKSKSSSGLTARVTPYVIDE